jgi:hypothetical protein
VLLDCGFGGEYEGSCTIGERRGIRGGDGSVLRFERWAESAGLGFIELDAISKWSTAIGYDD